MASPVCFPQVEVTLTFESAFWNTAPSASNEASEQAVQPLPAGTLLGACTGSEAGTRGLFNVFVVGSEPNTLTALASGEAAEKVRLAPAVGDWLYGRLA